MQVPDFRFPAWVDDPSRIDLTRARRALRGRCLQLAREKLRLAHNAAFKWAKGETLTAEEEALCAEVVPDRWPDNPPTVEQVRTWAERWWKPRNRAISKAVHALRAALDDTERTLIPLQNIIG